MTTRPTHDHRKTFIDRCFNDKEGDLALAAWPNLPIIVWALAAIASRLLHGEAHKVLADISLAGLVVWAVLEVLQGVNYFRRLLGLIVLIVIIVARV